MQRTEDHKSYPEIELSIKLSQLEGAFKFLDHVNNQLEEAPRNVTERETVKRNLARVQECRELFKQIISKHRIEPDSVPAVQIQKCV
jgi:predicted ATPase